jgi:hypothetical protein
MSGVAGRLLERAGAPRYIAGMATRYVCVQCDRDEESCECEKYCWLCSGWHNVRLCADGQYYCQACREACDMTAQSSRQ